MIEMQKMIASRLLFLEGDKHPQTRLSYNLRQKKIRILPGGLRPPDPPIWACWGRPRGGYHPWGYCWCLLADFSKFWKKHDAQNLVYLGFPIV